MPITPNTFTSKVEYLNLDSILNNLTLDEAADVFKFETMLLDSDAYTQALVKEGLVFIQRDGKKQKLEVVVSNGDDSQHMRNYTSPLEAYYPPNIRYCTPTSTYRMPILNGQAHGHQKSVRLSVAIDTLVETGSIFTRD